MKAISALMVLFIEALGVLSASILFLALEGLGSWLVAAGYALHLGLAVSATSGGLIVHNMLVDRIVSELNAEDMLTSIEEHLKAIGYVVGSTDQRVNVLLDQNRNAGITVLPKIDGCELRVHPSLTPTGLGSMISYSVILPFCGIVALIMSYRSARKTADFSARVLRPTISYLEERERGKGKESERQVMKNVITKALKKADRLATEAFMALKASYIDSKWYLALAGFLSYASIFFFLIWSRNWYDAWPEHYTIFMGFMLASIIILVALAIIWLRMRYRRESDAVNMRIGELQAAIFREEGTLPTKDGDEAALETLLNVCPDIPSWTKYRTRNFYMRNPNIASTLAWAMFFLFIIWSSLSSSNLAIPIGAIFAGTVVLLYVATRMRNNRSDQRSLEEWRSRIGTLKAELETKLREL